MEKKHFCVAQFMWESIIPRNIIGKLDIQLYYLRMQLAISWIIYLANTYQT